MPGYAMYLTALAAIAVGGSAIAAVDYLRYTKKEKVVMAALALDKNAKATVSTTDLPFTRGQVATCILGALLVIAGLIALPAIWNRHDNEDAAIIDRIEATYGVTVNDAGKFRSKAVSRWEIDGNLMHCFFTSSDMNDENLHLFCKHWDADDSAEYVTPNNLTDNDD